MAEDTSKHMASKIAGRYEELTPSDEAQIAETAARYAEWRAAFLVDREERGRDLAENHARKEWGRRVTTDETFTLANGQIIPIVRREKSMKEASA